jgi:hypothetical protein
MTSATVMRTTWSLNEVVGPVVANVDVPVLKHSM